MISLKNLTAAPARLQRMLLRLQQYDMVITYRPGMEMLLADALSRLPSGTSREIKLDLQSGCHIHVSLQQEPPDQDHCRDTVRPNPLYCSQTDLEWLGWSMTSCPQYSQALLWLQRWTFHQWWAAPERWTCCDSPSMQRKHHGWSPQEPCRYQQSTLPSGDMCLLAWHGSRCDWLHQEMPDVHWVQPVTCRDTVPLWGPSRTLDKDRCWLLSRP